MEVRVTEICTTKRTIFVLFLFFIFKKVLKHGLVSFVDFEQENLDHAKYRIKLLKVIKQKEREG